MTLLALPLAAVLAAPVRAATVDLRSGPVQVRLVEEYGSEGCSSCPPADDWLRSLGADPGLWRTFVPVSFHVDYWDYLGWKDRFGDPAWSARRRRRASARGERGVHTPEVDLDGEEWRGWGEGVPASRRRTGALEARVAGGIASVRFETDAPAKGLRVLVARLGRGLASDVTAGENAGSVLRHDFVVRGLAEAAMVRDGRVWSARVALPPGSGPEPTREALAVWVEDSDGRPLQAVGGLLPSR